MTTLGMKCLCTIAWIISAYILLWFGICFLNLMSHGLIHCTPPARWWNSRKDTWSVHDDVIKWKHFPRYWPFVRGIHRFPVNFPHKGQWRGALMFTLICARINDWVNNHEAGDLRRYRPHYDVIVTKSDMAQGEALVSGFRFHTCIFFLSISTNDFFHFRLTSHIFWFHIVLCNISQLLNRVGIELIKRKHNVISVGDHSSTGLRYRQNEPLVVQGVDSM